MDLPVTFIYHITHVKNLPRVIAEGGLHCDRHAQEVKTVNIGHMHIKERRLNRPVPVGPGGTVGDYVPFYFAPRSPMLYAISRGAVEGYAEGQNPVIYLRSTVEAVAEAGLGWVFTEGHADMLFTDFFDDLSDLEKVDWALMRATYWNDTNDDPDRKRRSRPNSWCTIFSLGSWCRISEYMIAPLADAVGEIIKGGSPEVGVQRGWYY